MHIYSISIPGSSYKLGLSSSYYRNLIYADNKIDHIREINTKSSMDKVDIIGKSAPIL